MLQIRHSRCCSCSGATLPDTQIQGLPPRNWAWEIPVINPENQVVMERIEIKPMTSLGDAVKKVLEIAEQTNRHIVAEFNGFLINSEYDYDKNINLYFAYKARQKKYDIDWEQRRYEIAKEMLPFCMKSDETKFPSLTVYNIVRGSAKCAVRIADALIKELKGEVVRND